MLRFLTYFSLLILTLSAEAQVNLVVNGGFEDNVACPSGLSQTTNCYWRLPEDHIGSSDYFHECGASFIGVPTNFRADSIWAIEGQAYLGGYAGLQSSPQYREYICDTLAEALVAGASYVVSFMWHNSDVVDLVTDDLGFHLTDTLPTAPSAMWQGTIESNPTSHNTSGNYLTDTTGWNLYSDTIIAEGGEMFITIGQFDATISHVQIRSNGQPYAYMFYDSVSIYVYGEIGARNHCFGEAYQFESAIDTIGLTSTSWNFGDPGSGSNNTSSLLSPTHTFSDTGTFEITLIVQYGTAFDTLTQPLFVYPRQTMTLGPDTTLCFPDSLELDIETPFSDYLWSDSSTGPRVTLTTDTTVWAILLGVCDTLSDTITVQADSVVSFDFGPDTSFCEGNFLILDAALQAEAFVTWNTGDSGESIIVTETGLYIMRAANACGIVEDSINVEVYPNPDTIDLPPDTINCFDAPIVLTRPDVDGVEYYWPDSNKSEQLVVDTTQTVWLVAINECGIFTDTIDIVFNGEIQTELGEDTTICPDDTLQLVTHDSLATYLWNTGDTADSIWSTPEEDFTYVVTITLRDCQEVESKRIEHNDLSCPSIDCDLSFPNVITPNGDGFNDFFRVDTDCDIFYYDMSIYNRWGQLVYNATNTAYGWDGHISGEIARPGTYYYNVEFRDAVVVDADRQSYQGSFTILH